MKKLAMLFVLVVVAVSLGFSQSAPSTTTGNGSGGAFIPRPTDILALESWTPFAADSSATVYSGKFSIADYDTVYSWVYATSATDVPKFSATLQGSFNGTIWETSSTRTICDTTTAKLEVLTYYGKVATNGARWARLALVGSTVTPHANHTDDIINFYLVGHKRNGSR